jgi:ABC-2 type transport system permease protein
MTATTTPLTSSPASPSSTGQTLRTVRRITGMEVRLLVREPSVLVGLVAFPAVTVLILAGVFGSEPDPEFAGVRPSEHYVVGYLGVVLAQMGLVTIPAHVASHRERGVTRRYRASGVAGGALVASHAALGSLIGLAAALIVLVVGGAVYGVPAPEDPLAVVAWIAAGVACFVALGIAIGTLVPSSRAATAIGNLVFVPMFLLGGGGPPRDVMTGPMQTLSDLLPLSHVVGGLRDSWLGRTDDPQALWWTALVAVAAVVFATRASRRRVA